MSMPIVADFVFDDDNEEKIARHGLSETGVRQVLTNDYEVFSNRRGRRGRYLMIGRDNGGQCIAIPIRATRDPTVWRPITAWPCKRNEEARLR